MLLIIHIGRLENLHLSSNRLELDGVPPDLATRLLSIYWTRMNSFFMIVYRPSFNKSWPINGPYFSKLLLNAMFFGGSRYMGQQALELRERFMQRFKHLLGAAYDKSRVTTIQALLIVSASLSAVGKDRSLAWLYSGMAYRMMFDLGLHTRNPGPGLNDNEQNVEMSRRLFWSAFGS